MSAEFIYKHKHIKVEPREGAFIKISRQNGEYNIDIDGFDVDLDFCLAPREEIMLVFMSLLVKKILQDKYDKNTGGKEV